MHQTPRAGATTVRLLALTLAVACARPEAAPLHVDSLDQILAAVPDSAMRQRWRDAAAKGQLAPLESLPVPRQALAVRTPLTARDSGLVAQPPTIAPQTPAEVRVASLDAPERFSGAFRVVSVAAGRVGGTIDGRQAPLDIIYKVPGDTAPPALAAGAVLRLTLRDEVVDGSQRAEVVLADASRVPVLFQVSDGSTQPYNRTFEDIPLTISQLAPTREGIAPLVVTMGATRSTMRPGQRATFTVGGARIEVLVLSSYWTPRERIEMAEGDPFHVRLVGYRRP